MTTVLYVGNFSAPWCTEVHVARDLRNNGCDVIEFQANAKMTMKTIAVLRGLIVDRGVDLVLWTRTIGWDLPPAATELLWRWAEERGVVTASFHLDLYLGLDRAATLDSDPFWTTGHVFTPDGNVASEAEFARRGITHHWMPPAIVSDECVPGQYREEYAHDVVFVGSKGYHVEWPWRRELIEGLAARYGSRFAHYGGEGLPTVRSGLHNGELEDGLWLNDLYHSAKVVVGDSLNLPGNVNYISDRYFEVMGRGGCLVAPYVPVLEDLGFRSEHFMPYHERDLGNITEQVDYLLGNGPLRGLMQGSAQAFVRDNHTYKVRLAEALRIMGLSS